jgi:hypothetical protein
MDNPMREKIAIEAHHASCANVPRFNPDYDRSWYPWESLPAPAKDAWLAIADAVLALIEPVMEAVHGITAVSLSSHDGHCVRLDFETRKEAEAAFDVLERAALSSKSEKQDG